MMTSLKSVDFELEETKNSELEAQMACNPTTRQGKGSTENRPTDDIYQEPTYVHSPDLDKNQTNENEGSRTCWKFTLIILVLVVVVLTVSENTFLCTNLTLRNQELLDTNEVSFAFIIVILTEIN